MTTRPASLDTFLGQKRLVDNLRVILGGAKFRHEPAPHMLFVGAPGLGKTSIASLIATEMGTKMVPLFAPLLAAESDLASVLMGVEEGDVVFIDEIHALPRKVEELLYTALEDFYLDVVVGPKNAAKTFRIELPRFTLVGATTLPGGITGPLRDRFGFTGKLEFYSVEDLCQIIKDHACSDNFGGTLDALRYLALASRGTPRIAIRLYERARDILQSDGKRSLDIPTAHEALRLADVDGRGLDATDRKILRTLGQAGQGVPVGLATLAATIGEDASTIERVSEPYLLRLGFIGKGPSGRFLTFDGLLHLEFTAQA